MRDLRIVATGRNPSVLEETKQSALNASSPGGDGDLDLLASLGGPALPGPFIGDPVLLPDAAEPQGLVGDGEVARDGG